MDDPVTTVDDEVDEQDELMIWGMLRRTPAERLNYLYGMIEFTRIARNARRVG